jgi:hypothetical protein
MTDVRCPLCGRKTTVDGATRVKPHRRGDSRGPEDFERARNQMAQMDAALAAHFAAKKAKMS